MIEIGVIALIQPIPPDYDWHYVVPRDDIGLEFELLDALTRSYKLIGHPNGWNKPFYVQDLLERHPTSQTIQIRILGRIDDLIVLATGEKVLPTNLEKITAEHPAVKDALVFGEARASLGLLVEISEAFETEYSSADGELKFLESLRPYVERGNTVTDSHGKISMNMIITTRSSSKPLLRTDKGSLARKANYAAFEEEIKQCYDKAEHSSVDPLPMPKDIRGDETLTKAIRTLILSCSDGKVDVTSSPEGDSVDFFEVGMDSLQATRLRRALQNALRSSNLASAASELPLDFVFQNSSLDKLTYAVAYIMLGTNGRSVDNAPLDRESRRIDEMLKMVERYVDEIKIYSSLVSAAHARPANSITRRASAHTKVVLLTGSTGSLGCMLLSQFMTDSTIDKIFCLNRPRDDVHDYQVKAMQKRGIAMKEGEWHKVVFLGANASQANLGLDAGQYEDVRIVRNSM
jgi:Male sterility protein/Phosphopantetheine attachment site